MTKIIWIDLDEVLAEFVDFALEHHNYMLAWKNIKKENIHDYYMYKMVEYDISFEESINWLRTAMCSDENLEIKPVNWALELLRKFKKNGYNLKIVTARDGDLFWEYTEKRVEKHYPNIFEKIIYASHFSSKSKTKSELCLENNISFMIEDNFDYAFDLAENWIYTFLLEKPWNKGIKIEHKNIKRVTSWKEINI